MTTIFLDVGAHRGQTLEAVRRLGFDRIHCFEPVSGCWPALERLATSNTHVERFGLWNRDTMARVFDPGSMGAGLWVKDRRRVDTVVTREACRFCKASDWFLQHVRHDDSVRMKLNCEGCECDVIDDLIDTGEFAKVTFLMVDFDARKISELRERLAATRVRLEAYESPRVMTSREAMLGATHRARIHHWLRLTGWEVR